MNSSTTASPTTARPTTARPSTASPTRHDTGELATRDWELWSCQARLVTAPEAMAEASALADEMLGEIERACSRFREDSEVRRLRAGWNDISPVLADLVNEALTAAWLSDGAVDPTLGRVLNHLGYDRDLIELNGSEQVATLANGASIRLLPTMNGWRALQLDAGRLNRPEHVHLDLGATAKAVAADRVAVAIHERLGTPVLVSLGGDIATAGARPQGWQVTVQDLPSDAPAQITLTAGAAVATSSTAKRTWTSNGVPRHHLIDPATGLPTTGPWRAVTVVAEDCARANTAATGSIVKGQAAIVWLRGLGLPARLVDLQGRVLHLNDFPTEQAA